MRLRRRLRPALGCYATEQPGHEIHCAKGDSQTEDDPGEDLLRLPFAKGKHESADDDCDERQSTSQWTGERDFKQIDRVLPRRSGLGKQRLDEERESQAAKDCDMANSSQSGRQAGELSIDSSFVVASVRKGFRPSTYKSIWRREMLTENVTPLTRKEPTPSLATRKIAVEEFFGKACAAHQHVQAELVLDLMPPMIRCMGELHEHGPDVPQAVDQRVTGDAGPNGPAFPRHQAQPNPDRKGRGNRVRRHVEQSKNDGGNRKARRPDPSDRVVAAACNRETAFPRRNPAPAQ